ncbi:MAG: OmpA family protein, partial [Gammaproteobacteria bacterium]|nr:OmpA family protein [Gammaproteobacteria bacterium]
PEWVEESRVRSQQPPRLGLPFGPEGMERPARPEMPEWVKERSALSQQPPHFGLPFGPEGMERPVRPEMPEWVKESRARSQQPPRFESPFGPEGMGRPALPEMPEWVRESRARSQQPPLHPYPARGGAPFGGWNRAGWPFANGWNNGVWLPYGNGWGAPYGPVFHHFPMAPIQPLPIEPAAPAVVEAGVETPAPVVVPAAVPASDGDGDGVPDVGDLCMESAAGAEVDAFGCVKEARIVLRGVNFKTDSDELIAESLAILDGVSDTLVANPEIRVMVAGHTDSDGDDAYNKDLSQRRAQSVVDYLAGKGVEVANMEAVGFGEEQPIAGNETAEGKAQNRRVELNRL